MEGEVDGLEVGENPAGLADVGEDGVEVGNVVMVGVVDALDFAVDDGGMAGMEGLTEEKVLDIQAAAGLEDLPSGIDGGGFVVGVAEGLEEIDDVGTLCGKEGMELVIIALVHLDAVPELLVGDLLAGEVGLDAGNGDGVDVDVGFLGEVGGGPRDATACVDGCHAGLEADGLDLVVQKVGEVAGAEGLDDVAIDFDEVGGGGIVEGGDLVGEGGLGVASSQWPVASGGGQG